MKEFGYHPRRTLDEASGNDAAPSELERASIKGVAAVLLAGAILACIEREIAGATDGSLLSVITAYAGGALHHVVSLVLDCIP
jgi:hypothetical protein